MQRYQNWPKHLATYTEVLGSETSLFIVHKYTSGDFSKEVFATANQSLYFFGLQIWFKSPPIPFLFFSSLKDTQSGPGPHTQHCLWMIPERQILVIPCQILQALREIF